MPLHCFQHFTIEVSVSKACYVFQDIFLVPGFNVLLVSALATPWKRRASHKQKVNLELKGFFLPKNHLPLRG